MAGRDDRKDGDEIDEDEVVPVPVETLREARGEKIVAVHRSKLASLRPFRRIRADRILGVIGVIALAAALILLFTWENPPEEEPSWPVEWDEAEHVPINATTSSLSEPGSGGPGQTVQSEEEHTFDVDEQNVTRVQVSVWWRDDIGNEEGPPAGDEFNVTLYGPDGSGIEVAARNIGNISETRYINITIPLAATPTIGEAPVETEQEARAYVAENANATTAGIGQWRVVVEMVDAGDAGDYPPEVGECTPAAELAGQCTIDTGNDYSITVRYYSFFPTFPAPEGG